MVVTDGQIGDFTQKLDEVMSIMDGSEYIASNTSSKVRIRFLLDNASDK